MIQYPDIDPVLVTIGPVSIHWYGIMYLIGFTAVWYLGRIRVKGHRGWTDETLSDLIFYGALGVILGGRLGYVLFYNLSSYIENPLNIFHIWEGGMSFHGGLIGVLIAMALFSRKTGLAFFNITDFLAPMVPIGLGAGRIGNFINGELWGRVTDAPWGMVFPDPASGLLPRHPSQIYEALTEGLLLFLVLWLFSRRPRPRMAVSGLFLLGYGCLRFLMENYRNPDSQLGFIAFDWLTLGQLLSIPLILAGILLLLFAYRKPITLDHE